MTTPLNVIGGFLGAGKTSAIQCLLGSLGSDERVAVIVNDFGEASLDTALLGALGSASIEEIDGGCVCCTAPEGFSSTVGRLLDEVRPTRILVEPTGLARPADLIDTLARGPHRDRLALGPLIVLVDPASTATEILREQPLLHQQAEAADVLVANRVDLAEPADLERFDRWAQSLWPGPMKVVRTTHGALDPDLLRWPEGEGSQAVRLRVRRTDGPSTAGFAVQSWIWGHEVVFSRKRMEQVFGRMLRGKLGTRVARAKGVFRTNEGVQRIDVAGSRVHLEVSPYRRDSRLDVILHGAAPPAGTWPRLTGWLDDAVCTAAELERDGRRVEILAPGGRQLSLDRAALAALPDGIDDVSTLVPKRQGTAARVSTLVAQHGLPAEGEVVVVASDGYVSPPVPVPDLLRGVLLHSVDGGPLPTDQGGPIRLLIPGDAGPAGPCSNVKGVVRLVFR